MKKTDTAYYDIRNLLSAGNIVNFTLITISGIFTGFYFCQAYAFKGHHEMFEICVILPIKYGLGGFVIIFLACALSAFIMTFALKNKRGKFIRRLVDYYFDLLGKYWFYSIFLYLGALIAGLKYC